MKVPKVTIGIPVFNGDQFLRKSIESIINQSYQDIEIIISDNCSTDNTEKICKTYAFNDKRIRYIKQSVNLGIFGNLEFVLSKAVGRYFMWSAADGHASIQ